jgi:predicted dehydrogenase
MKLRYALIGCGRIAHNHIAAVMNNSDVIELVAVCDLIPENMEKVLKPYEDSSTVVRYTDYKQMLKEQQPDFCAIATESGYHATIAMTCLNAGCHLIVEKPIALSLKDADEMIALAEEKGLVLCACHQNRFNKSVQKIKEAVDCDRFGGLLHGAAHIRWTRTKDYYDQANWRGTWELDGGALMNQCIHNIDLLRWMMGGELTQVMAYTDRLNHDYIEAEDLGLALLKFKNGAYGLVEGTTNVYPTNLEETLYLFGRQGTVKAGGRSVNLIEEWNFADKADNSEEIKEQFGENPPNVYGFGHTPLYADVVDAIINKRPPYVDGYAGKRALETVLAIYRSAATGMPVNLPLEDASTLEFKGRFS